ncbi:MAG: membrane protein insertase YidC [Planctomycetaceae bacterium]
MENRRLFTFLLLSSMTLVLWGTFVAPKLAPPPQKAADAAGEDGLAALDAPKGDKDDPVSDAGSQPGITGEPEAGPDVETETSDAAGDVALVEHPETEVLLGSLDAESGYALQVKLTSAGAAIETIQLTSPQFGSLQDETKQATILGNNLTSDKTLTTGVNIVDAQLKKLRQPSLERIHWKLEEKSEDKTGAKAVFSYDAPDGSIRIRKSFRLPKLRMFLDGQPLREAFRRDPTGHILEVAIELINLSGKAQTLAYEMQGPVGVLLENEAHTSKFRDIKIEFLAGSKPVVKSAKETVSDVEAHETQAGRVMSSDELLAEHREKDKWTTPFRYAGVDVQFFAALIAPLDERSEEEQTANKRLDRTFPMLVQRDTVSPQKSDISFRMASTDINLAAEGEAATVVHKYAFFAGPKRRELLDPLPMAASRVLDYGTYFGFVARFMHGVLDTLYGLGLPYFLAIITLTILVRGCMFPISRKQAISAAKMKALQPKLNELKEKFGEDREKLARAQFELWRKHKINPAGGCLPLFFQLPVFVGLYTALNTAIDLRLAKFLWIDNLAAPDSLAKLPFALPFLGNDFNLLPCVTVVLFLVQQKLFMPPAVDEQAEAQQKMMNFFTIMMGAMFWHQPAGLCLYFIASSLWGIAERKMLGTAATSLNDETSNSEEEETDGQKPSVRVAKPDKDSADKNRVPGFMQKFIDMAQEAREQAEKTNKDDSRRKKKRGK